MGTHHLMLKLKLDDPLDAVAVHGAGGLLGVLCVPFFMCANLEVRWECASMYYVCMTYVLLFISPEN